MHPPHYQMLAIPKTMALLSGCNVPCANEAQSHFYGNALLCLWNTRVKQALTAQQKRRWRDLKTDNI